MSLQIEAINPYYSPEGLELEMLDFDGPCGGYNFDTLCFWATKEGKIYQASDSGCSCPSPFGDFVGITQAEVLATLERVGSIEQATSAFDSWNKDYHDGKKCDEDERRKLVAWVSERLKL